MTLATRLALLEAQTKASRTAEDAIRRARFKAATRQPVPAQPVPAQPVILYRLNAERLGASADTGASGHGSPSHPIYRAYRELKMLHD